MHQRRLISLLLSPSLLSLSVSSFLSIIILGAANWSYISPSSALHDYLFGPYGLTTVLQNATSGLSAINGAFESPLAYNIAVPVFALFVGLIVYVFLQGADHVAAEATGHVDEVTYASDQIVKKRARKAGEIRAGLRILTIITWFIYLIFFARVLVPFAILFGRINTGHLWTLENAGRGLGALGLLLLSLHIQAIFLRLVVLRPRVFGSSDVVLEENR